MSETPKSNTLPELFDLTGRVAIVTGGAGMLGLRHAEAIAEAGGTPVLADLSPEALEAGVGHLRERTGVDALAVEVDISNRDGVQACHRVGERPLPRRVFIRVAGGSDPLTLTDTAGNPRLRRQLARSY